jgi:hypothetical protein
MNDDIRENKLTTADFVAVGDRGRMDERNGPNAENGAGTARAVDIPDGQSAPLFAADEGQRFRTNWTEIQTAFVDEPRKAVEQADSLVAEAIQRLAKIFADERAKLEHEWSRGEDQVSTEDLRVALRRYRSFFDRLLSV